MDGGSERPRELASLIAELRGVRNDRQDGGLVLLRLRERLKAQASRNLPAGSPLRARIDSDDLTQEALAHLVQVAHRFEGNTWAEFLAFVRKVMDQCKVDLARHHAREKRRPSTGSGSHQADAIDPRILSPSHTAMSRETHKQLLAAIEDLPDPYRSVVRMRLEEVDYETIAAERQISTANARQRFARGLEILREKLDGRDSGCRSQFL